MMNNHCCQEEPGRASFIRPIWGFGDRSLEGSNAKNTVSWSRVRIASRYVLRKGLPLHSYSKDGIGTLNPILGRGLDS